MVAQEGTVKDMRFDGMSVVEASKLPGVVDIRPTLARGKFAMALLAEDRGEHEVAEKRLAEACEAEGGRLELAN